MNTKQVLICRKDLKMRRGKEGSQLAHASMAFLTRNLRSEGSNRDKSIFSIELSSEEKHWMNNLFTKVCLQVNSEDELLAVVDSAKSAGLTVHLITDAGKTEFGGMPTNTCCAIGPHDVSRFAGITDHLGLY